MNIIFILILICLCSIIIVGVIPRTRIVILKSTALFLSGLIFFVSLSLIINFNYRAVSFQNSFELAWINSSNIAFYYGIDGISVMFIILTTFLVPLCILSSWESVHKRLKEFLLLLLLIEFFLINVFSVLDLVLFYVFFEGILIPMFIIIGLWGSRARKIQAAYQFFLYTFLGSVLMLLAIIFIYYNIGSTNYLILMRSRFEPQIQIVLWVAFFASFAIKIPMIPVHIWLPEAHVEAPTAGSVLLAGILLKLGTYGLLRFSISLFPYASHYFTPLVLTMSIVAIIYTSATTLRQIDLKKIIAYSSIAHMNLVTIGLFSMSLAGVEGAIFLMLSHGLVSSGLFLCIGVLYDRYGSRILRYYSGLTSLMPFFGLVFMIMSLANMGLPLTSAFIGEFGILLGAFNVNSFVAVLAASGVIFSGAYSVWLYNRVMFGPLRGIFVKKHSDLNKREFFNMTVLSFLVIYFGIFPNSILEMFHVSVTKTHLSTLDWPIYSYAETEPTLLDTFLAVEDGKLLIDIVYYVITIWIFLYDLGVKITSEE